MPKSDILNRRVMRAGQILIREGDHGDAAFFIQSGIFEVCRQAGDKFFVLARLGENSIVGEMALIDNDPRSATVRCVEPGTVIVLDRATFEKRLRGLDKFTRALLQMFSSKLRMMNGACLAKTKLLSEQTSSMQSNSNSLLEVWTAASQEERLGLWQAVMKPVEDSTEECDCNHSSAPSDT